MHERFSRPVAESMSARLHTATPKTPVAELARMLHERAISAVPIVDGDAIVGVVSRSDLIELGLLNAGRRWTSPVDPLPHRLAETVMTRAPKLVAIAAPLHAAARLMHDHQIHRVFVVDGDRPVGAIGTAELAAAVRDARIETPLAEEMTAMVIAIEVDAPVSAALDLLAQTHVTGLIVTDAGLPIGMFTQTDALACRDLPRGTSIDTLYDAGVICLPVTTKLHRAAAHAAELDVRRIVACRAGEAVGVLAGMDFARVIASATS